MNYFFLRWMCPWLIGVLMVAIIVVMVLRKKMHKSLLYRYSLATAVRKNSFIVAHPHKKIIYAMRFFALCLLAIVIGKPQLVDSRSKVPVQGIDIVLVLDVSGSMQLQDYDDDRRSRFDIAKAEAVRFIEKRDHDALGLVLFGKDTVSCCPITSDKLLLREVVQDLKLGVVDPSGTVLVRGIVTAANRLKHSVSKSKVMIVLTDGEPSEGDMDPSVGIDVAKKLGIKIYTVGIGSEKERLFVDSSSGALVYSKVNKELLTKIAHQTGGHYFMAASAGDMRRIYDTIDKLETTDHDVPVFSVYYDLVIPFVVAIILLLFSELFLSTFVWFAL